MHRTARYLFAIVLYAAMAPLLLSGATANGGHPKRGADGAPEHARSADADEERWERDPLGFSARERDAIRAYYERAYYDDGTTTLVPAAGKRAGNFPPASRVQKNGTLPAGWQQQIEPLAGDLERRLRPLYSGYSRGTLGQDVVIVDDRTLRVIDIVRDVRGR